MVCILAKLQQEEFSKKLKVLIILCGYCQMAMSKAL